MEEVYREYIEITDDGPPYTVAVRMCHDFPQMRPTDQNQLAVFDERVAALMGSSWAQADMPTDTFGVLVC